MPASRRVQILSTETKTKRCGLVVRVSTDMQAANPEGSLTNQLQRLQDHIAYKNNVGGEPWAEARIYTLRGISGKDSVRSKEFAQLFEDIETGLVNTVICTALDRISRSVKDFLGFFEHLNERSVAFVCLKGDYDTTTAHGRFIVNLFMSLAQLEREQTSERNRDASLARAQRGLWNGGQLLGYDLPDEGKKGTLIPNEREAVIVRAAFDLYLETGSILETARALNDRGYRTKEFTSRRGKHHPGAKFVWASTGWLLKNKAYIAKKEILKKKNGSDCQIIDAAWPPIVSEETFRAVQHLLAENEKTRTNQVRQTRHVYVFNHGLLSCGKCGGQMEGRSGTGRKRTRHYYYVCRNRQCGIRIPAPEIEKVVLERIRILASDPEILKALVAETNRQLRTELPKLEEQTTALKRQLADLNSEAESLMKQIASRDSGGNVLIAEKLDDLADRRRDMQAATDGLQVSIGQIQRQAVDETIIRQALAHISEVYECLPPYRRKDLIRLVLEHAEVSETELRLTIKGRPPTVEVLKRGGNGSEPAPRSETSKWLLGLMSQSSVVCDLVSLQASRGLWYVLRLRLAA